MSALGINVSDKDKEHGGWTGLVSGHKLTEAIYDADREEKRLWDFFTSNVDSWIEQKYAANERGDKFGYQELANRIYYWQEKAELATLHAQNLRKQRYCPHRIVRYTPEDTEVHCVDCDAEVVIHDSSIADSIDEWQS